MSSFLAFTSKIATILRLWSAIVHCARHKKLFVACSFKQLRREEGRPSPDVTILR